MEAAELQLFFPQFIFKGWRRLHLLHQVAFSPGSLTHQRCKAGPAGYDPDRYGWEPRFLHPAWPCSPACISLSCPATLSLSSCGLFNIDAA